MLGTPLRHHEYNRTLTPCHALLPCTVRSHERMHMYGASKWLDTHSGTSLSHVRYQSMCHWHVRYQSMCHWHVRYQSMCHWHVRYQSMCHWHANMQVSSSLRPHTRVECMPAPKLGCGK
jgi:hypothetical protein